jgi:hypothetical protein
MSAAKPAGKRIPPLTTCSPEDWGFERTAQLMCGTMSASLVEEGGG